MADRYWVGGTATWNATAGLNWASISGGTGGQAAPTSVDDVFFDSGSSSTYTVTIGTAYAASCKSLTTSGAGVKTIAGGGTQTLTISGSMTLVAGTVWSSTRRITFNGTGSNTLTTNGTILNGDGILGIPVNVNVGSGNTLTLGSALNTYAILTLTDGTFNANGFAVTCFSFDSNNSNTRALTLGGGLWTLTMFGAGAAWDITATTNLTFTKGASNIEIAGNYSFFYGGGLTYNNVSWTYTAAWAGAYITGANTFSNLTFPSNASSPAISVVEFNANQTVSGTLTLGTTNNAVNRIRVAAYGVTGQVTLTVATIATLSDIDFLDIVAAGASGTWSGTRLGNAGNNSNITFPAAKTVYWNLAGGASWGATAWATSSGGVPAVNNFPLAQDTAVFDDAGSVTVSVSTLDWTIGNVNASARTIAMTFYFGNGTYLYGNWLDSSSVTLANLANTNFKGRGTQQLSTFTTWDVYASSISVDCKTGTLQLQRVWTFTNDSAMFLLSGTLSLNGFNITASTGAIGFLFNNTDTKSVSFGANTIRCGNLNVPDLTNATFTGAGGFLCTAVNALSLICGTTAGAASNAPNISVDTGSAAITFGSGTNWVKDLVFTGNSSTVDGTVSISGNFTLATGGTYTSVIPTFVGSGTVTTSGKTLPSFTVSGAGITTTLADALTVTGAVTLTLGTLSLKSGVTTTVGSFVTTGTTLKYLNSTAPGTRATISDSSGTDAVTYLSIKDSSATGGATWDAYSSTNLNAGNNFGWNFPDGFFAMFM